MASLGLMSLRLPCGQRFPPAEGRRSTKLLLVCQNLPRGDGDWLRGLLSPSKALKNLPGIGIARRSRNPSEWLKGGLKHIFGGLDRLKND